MSNLGAYQWFTTNGKKVGGAKNLIGLIAAAGAVGGIFVFEGGKAAIKKIVKTSKKHKETDITLKDSTTIYKISARGVSNEGLEFDVGDEIRVLESDKDAVLIEKIGDQNNPYYVSVDLLRSISNYK